ncbi:hypothetical protein [Xanthobacter sp. NM-44]|uniref:hypothetical protein n=1 Tax=Xanthobacter sp. NM-44 TaxID=2744466 RepID=UPI001F3D3D8C|nr:hypothetical protein [Xanthobacter sp. NM-44]
MTALLLPLAVLLTACVSEPVRAVKCPSLVAPPTATIDVMEKACKAGDTATCNYAVALDKHYQKLDRCGG